MNLEKLRKIGVPKKFNVDDIIFHQGEPGDDMHVLLSGKVAVFINSLDGFPIKVAEIVPGGIFGEMSILEGLPRSATVIAIEKSISIAFKKDNFQSFITNFPEMTYKLLKVLSSRVRYLNEQLSQSRDGEQQSTDEDFNAENDFSPEHSKDDSFTQDTPEVALKIHSPETSSLFPAAHKKYPRIETQGHEQFLFEKSLECPACNYELKVKMQRLSKMKILSIEPDFRQKYHGFEPIYYSVWMCLACYYANFYSDFENITKRQVALLQDNASKRKSMINIHLMQPDDINYYFAHYYMADQCIKEIGGKHLNKAKIWIRLKWLYQDMKDEEMYRFALSRTLDNYYKTLYNSRFTLNPEQEQQIYILLGELFLENNQNQDALKHFMAASRLSGGKKILQNRARDRVWDLKGMINQSGKDREDTKTERRKDSKGRGKEETIFLKA